LTGEFTGNGAAATQICDCAGPDAVFSIKKGDPKGRLLENFDHTQG
jgi:hypothetical protein